ncbi:alcohol dehydrogenase [Actinocorallia herbida]|uniref:Alcohol dehydrogenase n=1 Tax=Actinocorallia herbida TaxID=58109 RepID=A0A3N1CWI9_9ACTN|nr:zinc-binding dehydrogenase [Actinocorallia herbida]ROO85657.1 alcohol dehydrogenase [Actinocorallia herbida]
MSATAHAVVYKGPETFSLETLPLPALGSGDLLIEVLLCGVDGSELHMYRGEFPWLNEVAPVIFGDEILGRVSAIGDAASEKRGLKVGDRVVVESRWPCDGCRTCAAGQYYLCETRGNVFLGYGTMPSGEPPHLWGGYATHTFVPESALVYKVPDALPDTTALIACSPLANGLRWAGLAGAAPGAHVAVIGPGTQGLACALAARCLGAKVTVIGLASDAERLEMAASFGADATLAIEPGEDLATTVARVAASSGPVDGVIETAGAGSAKELAVRLLRPLGVMVNVSVPSPAAQPVDWMALMQKEITIVNPLSHPHTVERAFTVAAGLLADGTDIGSWITHTFPLEEAAEAIALASYQRAERPVKVALKPAS